MSKPTAGMHVHIIENSTTQAEELKSLLTQLGHMPTHSSSLCAALAFLKDQPDQDAVILDLTLPDASQLSALETLREQHPRLAIVVLAAKADNGLCVDAMRMGAQDYLSKKHLELYTLERSMRYAVERQQLVQEMADKNALLEVLNDQKNRLLGIAAHDLRNPLSTISAYSQLLSRQHNHGGALSDRQLTYVTNIQRSCHFMRQLIDDLLDFSAIESGRLVLNRSLTPINSLLVRNAKNNGLLAERKGVRLELELVETLPTISIDAFKIEQVLDNLLSNAIKFSKAGQSVHITSWKRDAEVAISVRDEGPGISDPQLQLFKPFGTVVQRGTNGEKGTGLGLAIAHRIVDSHGGRIWLESKLGEGAKFTFTLPCVF